MSDLVRIEISILAPHEGERRTHAAPPRHHTGYFNPRSPRGGATHSAPASRVRPPVFQSSLPTRGSDRGQIIRGGQACHFNPRSPRGGATEIYQAAELHLRISILAPHEGERLATTITTSGSEKISILAPHEGERPIEAKGRDAGVVFQSSLPTRGSDSHQRLYVLCGRYISILAPHEGERPVR